MRWRKGSGTCEVWALLGFVEAPLPLLVSITRPGSSQPATWRRSQPEQARQHLLQALGVTGFSRGLGAGLRPAGHKPGSAPSLLSDLSEPQFLFFCKTGRARPPVESWSWTR